MANHKLYNPPDQAGHERLGLNGRRPPETGGHWRLLQCNVEVCIENTKLVTFRLLHKQHCFMPWVYNTLQNQFIQK